MEISGGTKMKKLLLAALLIAILISGGMLAGCKTVLIDAGNGPTTTKEYDFTDFTGIEIGHAFELEVTPSDTYKITVTAPESVLDRIDVSKVGSTLKIDMDTWFFSWHSTPKVTITMPDLRSLNLSGASRGDAREFKSPNDFDLHLSGASNLDIDMEMGGFRAEISGASRLAGYLKASSSDIELSGASRSDLKGSAGDIKLDASGASQANLADFSVEDASIELSGASRASLTVNGRMDASLSGVSSLEYYGNPIMGNLDISGVSDIEHKTAP
jgi:hypothetical protein